MANGPDYNFQVDFGTGGGASNSEIPDDSLTGFGNFEISPFGITNPLTFTGKLSNVDLIGRQYLYGFGNAQNFPIIPEAPNFGNSFEIRSGKLEVKQFNPRFGICGDGTTEPIINVGLAYGTSNDLSDPSVILFARTETDYGLLFRTVSTGTLVSLAPIIESATLTDRFTLISGRSQFGTDAGSFFFETGGSRGTAGTKIRVQNGYLPTPLTLPAPGVYQLSGLRDTLTLSSDAFSSIYQTTTLAAPPTKLFITGLNGTLGLYGKGSAKTKIKTNTPLDLLTITGDENTERVVLGQTTSLVTFPTTTSFQKRCNTNFIITSQTLTFPANTPTPLNTSLAQQVGSDYVIQTANSDFTILVPNVYEITGRFYYVRNGAVSAGVPLSDTRLTFLGIVNGGTPIEMGISETRGNSLATHGCQFSTIIETTNTSTTFSLRIHQVVNNGSILTASSGTGLNSFIHFRGL